MNKDGLWPPAPLRKPYGVDVYWITTFPPAKVIEVIR